MPNPFQRLALVILRLGLRCLRLLQATARGLLQVIAQAVARLKSGCALSCHAAVGYIGRTHCVDEVAVVAPSLLPIVPVSLAISAVRVLMHA